MYVAERWPANHISFRWFMDPDREPRVEETVRDRINASIAQALDAIGFVTVTDERNNVSCLARTSEGLRFPEGLR